MGIREKALRGWRSVPVFGLGAHYGFREERLERAREEDAAYREIMASLGQARPDFAHASEQQERWIMTGELAGFALAQALGVALHLRTRNLLLAWLFAWALAVVADALGGRIAVWLFERAYPVPDEVAGAEDEPSGGDQAP